jgi:ATP-binding cassette subfamily B protein
MDRLGVVASAIPGMWLVAGVAALLPAFMISRGLETPMAISLGGILLAYRALVRLALLLPQFAVAVVAWKSVQPIVTAREPDEAPLETFVLRDPQRRRAAGGGHALIEARDLSFRYGSAVEPILRGCAVRIERGDRVLLEGASGSGKSTLGALLAGLRLPGGGLLLLEGIDRGTLGRAGWRQRVVSAPQFHDNHVFSASLAFNVLMGLAWPPRPGDVRKAEVVCRELGLGPLIERMPAGMLQMVGDMGWQLSHGERSRVFVARTLLQSADLIVLDESFAALDPETLKQCGECVLDRAPALLMIAHP